MSVRIEKIRAGYMDGWQPLEPEVNNFLRREAITKEELIRVTFHVDRVGTKYPPPHDYDLSVYAIIYYDRE